MVRLMMGRFLLTTSSELYLDVTWCMSEVGSGHRETPSMGRG